MKSKTIPTYIAISANTLFCIFINFFFNHLVIYLFKIPLFLDTVGTIILTFSFGTIPGIICAVITTIVDSIIAQYFLQLPMLYVFCSISAVFLTSFFKKYIFNTDSKSVRTVYLFILSITMCILISIMGGIIDSICTSLSNYTSIEPVASDYFKPSFFKLGFSKLGTNIMARFPVNIIDRPLTVFISYGIVCLSRKIFKWEK